MVKLSTRLTAVADALPLRPGLRVLEIGCGPGALARELAARIGDGFALGIDRSAKAIAQAEFASQAEISAGRLAFRVAAIEDLILPAGMERFDLAVAIRVGALDGRHPAAGAQALARLAKLLTPDGRLYIDGGDPLRALPIPR